MQEMKIAKIINSKQVIVNAGTSKGIKKGDYLEIIDKFGTDPVIDPDTGENLGTLDISKGTLVVTKAYPKMAIAESPKDNDYLSKLSNTFMIYQPDLNVDPTEISGGLLEPSGNPIRVGDIVIKR